MGLTDTKGRGRRKIENENNLSSHILKVNTKIIEHNYV